MDANKVLVKDDNTAIITCPSCHLTKKISVADYKGGSKRNLRIKCTCSHIFHLCLEHRRHPRKHVKFLGKSINLSRHRERQNIIIKDISLGGVGFYSFDLHHARRDDHMLVLFNLNDVKMTSIGANVTVRNITDDYFNCEFAPGQNFMSTLGFYLLS